MLVILAKGGYSQPEHEAISLVLRDQGHRNYAVPVSVTWQPLGLIRVAQVGATCCHSREVEQQKVTLIYAGFTSAYVYSDYPGQLLNSDRLQASTYSYCKTRKFNLQFIFTIFADEANPWKLNAGRDFGNDIEENCHWIVKIKWWKMFGWANQRKFILARFSLFTVYSFFAF